MASQGAKVKSNVRPRTTEAYRSSPPSGTSEAAKTKPRSGGTAQQQRRSGSVRLTGTVEDAYDQANGIVTRGVQRSFGSGSDVTMGRTAAAPAAGPRMMSPSDVQKGWLFQRVQWNGSQLQAPTGPPSVTATTATFQKATSARLILLAMGVSGAAILIKGAGIPNHKATVNGKTINVPGNLQAFAGVVIAGTVALVINEVSPDIGVVFAASMTFIALANASAFGSFGKAIFGGGTAQAPGIKKAPSTGGASNLPNVSPNTPSPQGGQWLPGGNPGVQPGGQGPIEVPYGSPSG